jgi:tetratricopeptide (TPR) repeat protein
MSLNFLGEPQTSRLFLEESLEIYRDLGDTWAIAFVLFGLGSVAMKRRAYESAQSLWEQCAASFRKIGDRFSMRGVFNNLGEIARAKGDYQKAVALYEESIEVERAVIGRIIFPLPLGNWARVSLRIGDLELGLRLAKQCLTMSREQGNLDSLTLAMAILAEVMGVRGKPEQGAKVLGAVEAARETAGVPMGHIDRVDYEYAVAAIRARLDSAAFNAAWAAGRAMSLEKAVEYALGNVKSDTD